MHIAYNDSIQKSIYIQFHRTPLIVAAAKGVVPLVELLIKYNASLDLVTNGKTEYSSDILDWSVT